MINIFSNIFFSCIKFLSTVVLTSIFLGLPVLSAYANETAAESKTSLEVIDTSKNVVPLVSTDIAPVNPKDSVTNQISQAMDQTTGVKVETTPANWFHGENVHRYLGYTTVALAGLTWLASPDDDDDKKSATKVKKPRDTTGTHAQLARATVISAVSTVTAGLIYHWNHVDAKDGLFDRNNIHALLGITGAVLMAMAVQRGDDPVNGNSHDKYGMIGGIAMGVGVSIQW